MNIIIGGRELTEDEKIAYLVETFGWSESRARQRVHIGAGKSRGDVLRLEPTKPLNPDSATQSRRPKTLLP